MAVTPIRRSMTPVQRSGPAMAPAQNQIFLSPANQGWWWDGDCWFPPQSCCPPQCPPPVQPLTGPIIGVVDGSDAAPGMVGEYNQSNSTFSFTAYPNVTTVTISALVVQPGDWDLWAFATYSTDIGGSYFNLNPLPTGMTYGITGLCADLSVFGGTQEELVLIGTTVRGSFIVPTLLAFTLIVNQGTATDLLAGTGNLVVQARRRR